MNILITGAWSEGKNCISEIEAAGHRVVFLQQEADPLPCAADWVEGVICNGLFLHHPIAKFTNLRYIQLTSVGFDRVPMEEVERRNIEIHNARGVYSIPMAEFAMAGVLDIYKCMGQFRDQQRDRKWIKNRQIRELAGSRVLIVGCGSVGSECAKRFKAFGCIVIGADLMVREDKNYDRICGMDRLDQELERADIVILTLPLTRKTRGLIDRRKLNLIKESSMLVNISRGGVIDQQALEEWGGAAVLDVFEEEPLAQASTLWNKKNYIITPHNSFVGDNNNNRLKEVIINNLREALQNG